MTEERWRIINADCRVGIEQQEEYVRIAEARIRHAESNSE